jgi:hypothetical protein
MGVIDVVSNKNIPGDFELSDNPKVLKEKILIKYNGFITIGTMKLSMDKGNILVNNLLVDLQPYITENIGKYFSISKDDLKYDKIYQDIVKDYIDLTPNEFNLTVEYILFNTIPDAFSEFSTDITKWISDTNDLKNFLKLKHFESPIVEDIDYTVSESVCTIDLGIRSVNLIKVLRDITLDSNLKYVFVNTGNNVEIKVFGEVKPDLIKNGVLRKTKGLIFGSPNVVLTSTGRLITKSTWDTKIKYKDLKCDVSNVLITKLSEILKISPENPVISRIVVKTIPKKFVPLDNIQLGLRQFKEFKFVEIRGNTLKFLYSDNLISIKIIDIVISSVINKRNEILINNVTTDPTEILLKISDLLKKSESLQPMIIKNGAITSKNKQEEKETLQPLTKLKVLKNLGVNLNSKSCQKNRQPMIKKSPPPESYSIHYEDNILTCQSPDYPFPGYTSQGSPCCFKKDQRDKPNYRRYSGKTLIKKITDQEILSRHLITTEKPLDPYRLGVNYKILQKIFGKSFLRLGITEVPSGDINIITFDITGNKVTCKDIDYFPYDSFAFIVKTNGNPELLVQVVSNKITREFPKNSTIVGKVLNVYKKSCITKYPKESPLSISRLIKKGIKIYSQIINAFGNVTYVSSNYGVLPVFPSNKNLSNNIPTTSLTSIKIDVSKQYKLLLESGLDYVKPVYQTSDGILVKCGLIIPVKGSKDIQLDLDDALHCGKLVSDSSTSYILAVKHYKNLYTRFKYLVSQSISGVSRTDKINVIESAVHKAINNKISLPIKLYNNFVKKVSLEIKSDKNKKIIEGKIKLSDTNVKLISGTESVIKYLHLPKK